MSMIEENERERRGEEGRGKTPEEKRKPGHTSFECVTVYNSKHTSQKEN
jgi:hypothetical protein